MHRLRFDAALEQYDRQAADLIDAWRVGDRDAAELFKHNHPRFLRSDASWLPKDRADEDLRAAGLELDDARLAVARWYNFGGWPALASFAESVRDRQSPVYRVESAVEAVIDGDMPTLTSALRADPDLVRARSTRVMSYEPPHRSTLLHYVAANGVEGYRQRTPPNAVDVAKL